MHQIEAHVLVLEELATRALAGEARALSPEAVRNALNGQLAQELRRKVPLKDRQAAGAFFTSEELSARAVRPLGSCRGIYDPACGGGDLLLAWSKQAEINHSLPRTLESWARKVSGTDKQTLFIRAARARLVLSAVARGAVADNTAVALDEWFPDIRSQDSLLAMPRVDLSTDIVLNPPFVRMQSPEDCDWATGSVSSAAVFMDRCLRSAQPGTQITAILPDVLRSGSRYSKWRSHISSRALVSDVEVVGRFDPQVEVDVFIMRLTVNDQAESTRNGARGWKELASVGPSGCIKDHFHVSVGPVVPHRDPEDGVERPYLHSRNAPANGEVTTIAETRRFSARLYTPPLVVVRRTSNPGDMRRPVATLVRSGTQVLIENHLIVLEPRDGQLATCQQVMQVLSSQRTREWLDEEIRCRHLTVPVVAAIPWH